MIICKFGGTSVAYIKSIKKIKQILNADNDRQIVVVSAPGRTKHHDKVTDMLISVFNEQDLNLKKNKLSKIYSIYNKLVSGLKINIDIKHEFTDIFAHFEDLSYNQMISRGEYLSAKILSIYLQLPFVDSADIIFFNDNRIDIKKTKNRLKLYQQKFNSFITCGFYGTDENNQIKLFPRGGSDVTGAVICKCLNADIYENWSDTDGIYTNFLSPQKQRLTTIKFLTAKSICENGASILHKDVFYYLKNSNCKIMVKNTKNPLSYGTLIT